MERGHALSCTADGPNIGADTYNESGKEIDVAKGLHPVFFSRTTKTHATSYVMPSCCSIPVSATTSQRSVPSAETHCASERITRRGMFLVGAPLFLWHCLRHSQSAPHRSRKYSICTMYGVAGVPRTPSYRDWVGYPSVQTLTMPSFRYTDHASLLRGVCEKQLASLFIRVNMNISVYRSAPCISGSALGKTGCDTGGVRPMQSSFCFCRMQPGNPQLVVRVRGRCRCC